MFERYTDDARRSIFFARYEAQQRGSDRITPTDILLGVCHDPTIRIDRLTNLRLSAEKFRQRINEAFPPKDALEKDWDIPLDNSGKRVLAYAAEESEKLNDWWLDSSYLILGVFREGGFARELLVEAGLTAEHLREKLRNDPEPRRAKPENELAGELKNIRAISSDPSPRRLALLSALLIIAAIIATIAAFLKAS